MKTQILYIFMLFAMPMGSMAQDGYFFTLVHNGGYSFTVTAVSNYDSGTYTPKTESYGFTIVIPDGVTITITDVQPSGSSEIPNLIQGTSVAAIDPSMSDKDLYVITVTTNAGNLPNHSIGIELPLLTFDVDGSPTNGEVYILDNGSTLASNPSINGALDSFIQVDVTDDATVNFINGYLGQSGTVSYSFNTLGIVSINKLNLNIYPNPTSGIINLAGDISDITLIEVFNISGQKVKEVMLKGSEIDFSGLQSGIYLMRIVSDKGTKIFRIVRE